MVSNSDNSNNGSNGDSSQNNSNSMHLLQSQPLHPNTAPLPDYSISLPQPTPTSSSSSTYYSTNSASANLTHPCPVHNNNGQPPRRHYVLPIPDQDAEIKEAMIAILSHRQRSKSNKRRKSPRGQETEGAGDEKEHDGKANLPNKKKDQQIQQIVNVLLRKRLQKYKKKQKEANAAADQAAQVKNALDGAKSKLLTLQSQFDSELKTLQDKNTVDLKVQKEIDIINEKLNSETSLFMVKANRAEETLKVMEDQWRREDEERILNEKTMKNKMEEEVKEIKRRFEKEIKELEVEIKKLRQQIEDDSATAAVAATTTTSHCKKRKIGDSDLHDNNKAYAGVTINCSNSGTSAVDGEKEKKRSKLTSSLSNTSVVKNGKQTDDVVEGKSGNATQETSINTEKEDNVALASTGTIAFNLDKHNFTKELVKDVTNEGSQIISNNDSLLLASSSQDTATFTSISTKEGSNDGDDTLGQAKKMLGSERKTEDLKEKRSEIDKLHQTKSEMVWLLKEVIKLINQKKEQQQQKHSQASSNLQTKGGDKK